MPFSFKAIFLKQGFGSPVQVLQQLLPFKIPINFFAMKEVKHQPEAGQGLLKEPMDDK